MSSDSSASSNERMLEALESLESQVSDLPKTYGYIFRPSQNLWFTFLKGIVYGLGIITAVAVVIPLIVWLLQSIDWIPVIGDLVINVVERVEGQLPRL